MKPSKILLLLLALSLISACSPTPTTQEPGVTLIQSLPTTASTDATTSSTTSSPTPIPTSSIGIEAEALRGVSLQVWHAFAGATYDLFASQAAQFNATNEWGIAVDPLGHGDYAALLEAVDASLSANTPPDLVVALPEQILGWEATGAVVDLKPYLDDVDWGLGSAAVDDIPALFLAQDQVDGKQLGLPAQRSARFLFYNQTWARELGFDNPPSTADEFRQQACAANQAFREDGDAQNDGYGGWIVDAQWQGAYSWMLAFGGSAVDGDTYSFHTDPNLAAVEFIKKLFDDHCAWLSTEPTPFDSFARRSALFVGGDLAELSMEMDSMSRLGNGDEWTVIPFPGSQGSAVIAYGPSYTLLQSTPEKQLAAWLFVRWLLSPENQAQWVETTGLFPLRASLLDMIGSYREAYPQWEAAVEDLSVAQNAPQLTSWRKVRAVLEDGMAVIFQANTPVDQLSLTLDEMDSMARELSAP